MLPKPIIDILAQFDNLLGAVTTLNDNNEAFVEVANEIKLLKLWREEVESEKQSIYIIGKFSTGKSTFHNFILDKVDEKDDLFKMATSTETASIQTLEHCENRDKAFAEIIFTDKKELSKIILPKEIEAKFLNESIIIPLNNSKNINFFRENIIAKTGKINSFDLKDKIERINIKFPLKYLKNYRLLDTPGLDAADLKEDDSKLNKIKDDDVKKHLYAKSHIFWFIDGSTRTIPNDLMLLDKEGELIKNNIERISFIINKFDENLKQDEIRSIEGKIERKQELIKELNKGLNKFLNEDLKRKIYFTSFKNPNVKFPNLNTHDIINIIEDSKIKIEKESHHKNIHSLIGVLSKILESIKTNVILKNLEIVEGEIEAIEIKKKRALKLENVSVNICGQSKREIINAKNDIFNFTKDKKLNTHQLFKDYVGKFNARIGGYCQKINNSVIRIEEFKLVNFWKKLQQIKEVKKFTFKEKETFWKKYVVDSELDQKKIELEKHVQDKLKSLDSLISILNADIAGESERKLKEYDYKIHKKDEKRKYYNEQLVIIAESEEKINDLDAHLLKDIEQRVSKWKPENSHEKLENFLSLYSLLQEHNIIEQNSIHNE